MSAIGAITRARHAQEGARVASELRDDLCNDAGNVVTATGAPARMRSRDCCWNRGHLHTAHQSYEFASGLKSPLYTVQPRHLSYPTARRAGH